MGEARYPWMLTSAENKLMFRLRSIKDGMHAVTVRKVAGQIASVSVLSCPEEQLVEVASSLRASQQGSDKGRTQKWWVAACGSLGLCWQ